MKAKGDIFTLYFCIIEFLLPTLHLNHIHHAELHEEYLSMMCEGFLKLFFEILIVFQM